jgi:hypothetical protein
MRCLLFFFIGVLWSGIALGQGEANSLKGTPFMERIVTGGGLGAGFNRYQDFVSVSPEIGYQITRKLMAGTRLTYRYTNYKDIKPSVKFNDFGVGPFLRFNVYRNIFIQTEYEYLNYEDLRVPVTSAHETVRRGYSSFMAGGGFFQPIGQRVSFYLMALYNFSYRDPKPNEYSPYSSPLVLRVGINIGNVGF